MWRRRIRRSDQVGRLAAGNVGGHGRPTRTRTLHARGAIKKTCSMGGELHVDQSPTRRRSTAHSLTLSRHAFKALRTPVCLDHAAPRSRLRSSLRRRSDSALQRNSAAACDPLTYASLACLHHEKHRRSFTDETRVRRRGSGSVKERVFVFVARAKAGTNTANVGAAGLALRTRCARRATRGGQPGRKNSFQNVQEYGFRGSSAEQKYRNGNIRRQVPGEPTLTHGRCCSEDADKPKDRNRKGMRIPQALPPTRMTLDDQKAPKKPRITRRS